MNNQILYNCPQMESVAAKIGRRIKKLKRGKIAWNYFSDGFPNFCITDIEQAKNSDVVFLASLENQVEIFNQLSVIYALPRYLVRSLKVIIPFYPTGTMERVEKQGEIATAMSLARMLSAIPMTQTGPVQIIIFDIHALQEQFYFSDQVLVRLESGTRQLQTFYSEEEYSLAFPDDGAYKRFARYFPDYDKIICQKIRAGEKRIITIKEGDPRGKKIIIIDDLILTGGTLIECAQVLLAAGALEVLAYATHGVFPNQTWKKFTTSPISRIIISDSCPQTVSAVKDQSKFQIISLAPKIVDVITEWKGVQDETD